MAPDAEDCETARPDGATQEATYQGCRIVPAAQQPARAWSENEELLPNSPGESRRLLPSVPSAKQKSRLQAGVTLVVHLPGKHTKCPWFAAQTNEPTNKLQKLTKKVFPLSPHRQKFISLFRPPFFLLTIIFIMVCVHFGISHQLRERLLWAPGAWRAEPWRLVSYGLLHGSPTHLAMNILVGLVVGWVLEREQSWWRVMVVYFGGVVAGALGAGACQPAVQMVGASAAVYAVLTAHISNVCLRYGHLVLWWFRPLSVLVLMVSEGCWWLVQPPAAAAAPVAWSAHALGAVVGLLLGFLVFTGENTRKHYVSVCRGVSVIVFVSGLTWLLYENSRTDRTQIEKR